jgi:hypothetical protein
MVEDDQVKLDTEDSAIPDAEALVLTEEPMPESTEATAEAADNEQSAAEASEADTPLPNLPPIIEKAPPAPRYGSGQN